MNNHETQGILLLCFPGGDVAALVYPDQFRGVVTSGLSLVKHHLQKRRIRLRGAGQDPEIVLRLAAHQRDLVVLIHHHDIVIGIEEQEE